MALDSVLPSDLVFVVAGVNVERAVTPELLSCCAAWAGATSAGRAVHRRLPPAKAGLLDGHKAVIHWENLSALREEFPRVIFSEQLFAIDRDRYTCTGGVAPLDLMMHIIGTQQGKDITALISEQFILERIRSDQDRQHVPLQARVGLFHENLIEAAALMEANIEEPLSLDEIASAGGRVAAPDRAPVQRHAWARVPTRYYLDMRPAEGARAAAADAHEHHGRSRWPAASSRRRTSASATATCSAINAQRRAPGRRRAGLPDPA